jgi:hypothetical protein
MCPYCKRGVHKEAVCYSKLKDDYLKHYPNQPPPARQWIERVVKEGHKMPVNRGNVIKTLGTPPAAHTTGQQAPIDQLGDTYLAYLAQLGQSPPTPASVWCADSGATKHLCKNKELFTEYTPFHTPQFIQGATEGMTSQVLGWGRVDLHHRDSSNGYTNTLQQHQVLHVPNLHDNLLSLTRLDKHGLNMELGKGQCVITKGGDSYGTRTLHGGLYVLDYESSTGKAFVAQQEHPQEATDSTGTITALSTTLPAGLHTKSRPVEGQGEEEERTHKRPDATPLTPRDSLPYS